MRIDLLLCRLRFAKSRAVAQRRITDGHMRCNRLRVTRPCHNIAAGDILTLPSDNPRGQTVSVIEILALPTRRGPAAEAKECYRKLDAGVSFAIAEANPRKHADRIEGNTQK